MIFPRISIPDVVEQRTQDLHRGDGALHRDDKTLYTAFTLCEAFPSGLHIRKDNGEYYVGGRVREALCGYRGKLRDHPGQVTVETGKHLQMCLHCAEQWSNSEGPQKAWAAERSGVRLIPRPPSRYSLTIKQAAKQIGITVESVRRAIFAKRLRGEERGGAFWIAPRDADEYRNNRARPARIAKAGPRV